MTTPRITKRRVLKDAGRLVDARDVMYHVGNLLARRSLRYTMLTAGLSVLMYVGKSAGLANLPDISLRQAVALPLMVGGAALLGGRVYRHEADLGPRAAGIAGELGHTREGFFRVARAGLDAILPQTRQKHTIGIDIAFYEDWLDGAWFDKTDVKLAEQYEGSSTLRAIRKEVHLSLGDSARRLPARLAQKLWFALITRAVAVNVGAAVNYLNKKHHTDLFNAQVLLWPGEEDQPWLDDFGGARAHTLERRAALLGKLLGSDRANIPVAANRIALCDLCLATQLRARYDPRYAAGELGPGPLEDLESAGKTGRFVDRMQAFVASAREDLAAFDEFLARARAQLLSAEHFEARRAARIAFHIDKGGLKRAVLRLSRKKRWSEDSAAEINRLIDRPIEDKRTYTRRLISIRMHHTLTLLARQGYVDLLEALWVPARPAADGAT